MNVVTSPGGTSSAYHSGTLINDNWRPYAARLIGSCRVLPAYDYTFGVPGCTPALFFTAGAFRHHRGLTTAITISL